MHGFEGITAIGWPIFNQNKRFLRIALFFQLSIFMNFFQHRTNDIRIIFLGKITHELVSSIFFTFAYFFSSKCGRNYLFKIAIDSMVKIIQLISRFLRGSSLIHLTNGSPLKSTAQLQIGLWFITWHRAFWPQTPAHGFLHFWLIHDLSCEHSELKIHSGRQFGGEPIISGIQLQTA